MFHHKLQMYFKKLFLSSIVLLCLFFSADLLALDQGGNDRNQWQLSYTKESNEGKNKSSKAIRKINWSNIMAWLASLSLTSGSSNTNLPFFIPTIEPDKNPSELFSGNRLNLNRYSIDYSPLIKNTALDELKFDTPYESNKYFYNDPFDQYAALADGNNVITVGVLQFVPANNETIILKLLGRVGLDNNDEILEILDRNTDYLDIIANGLEILEKENILTAENISALLENPQHAKEIAQGLVILNNAGILTAINRHRLIVAGPEAITKAGDIVASKKQPPDGLTEEKIAFKRKFPEKEGIQLEETRKRIPQPLLDEEDRGGLSPFGNLFQEGEPDTHWYDDGNINVLLDRYVGDKIGNGLMHPINLEQREGGTLEDNVRDREQQLQELERLTGLRVPTIVLPVNLGRFNPGGGEYAGDHWAALHIHRPDRDSDNPTITYIDPFGHPIPDLLSQILGSLYPNIEIINPEIRFQHDGYNCGPWVVEILRQLVETDGFLPSQDFDIDAARVEHRSILNYNLNVSNPIGPDTVMSSTSVDSAVTLPPSNDETVNIIEKRIRRLATAVSTGLSMSNTIRNDEFRKAMMGFLDNFNYEVQEIIKSKRLSNELSVDMYRNKMLIDLIYSKKIFEDNQKKLLEQSGENTISEADAETANLIIRGLTECYETPFASTLDELRQEVLEKELSNVFANIPKITPASTCFISYAWGHAGHVEWVHNFAKHLMQAGIEVHLDVRDNLWGDIPRFITFIKHDDHVIVIGTPELRKKWEDQRGTVVGEEMNLVWTRYNDDKSVLVKVLLAGSPTDATNEQGDKVLGSFPEVIGSHISAGANFRHAAAYYKNLFLVIKKLYEGKQDVLSEIERIEAKFMRRKSEVDNLRDPKDIQKILATGEKTKKNFRIYYRGE